MNLRRATAADLKPLVALMRGEFTRMGIPTDMTVTQFQRLKSLYGITVLEDGGKLIAGLWAIPIQTADGPGFQVVAIAIDFTYPDPIRAADAICLFSLNRAVNRGGVVIRATFDTRTGAVAVIYQQGDAQAIMERIFERRPEWRLSL